MITALPPNGGAAHGRTESAESSSASYSSTSESSSQEQKPYVVRGNNIGGNPPPPSFAQPQVFRTPSQQPAMIGQASNPIRVAAPSASRLAAPQLLRPPITTSSTAAIAPSPAPPAPVTVPPRRIQPVMSNGTIPQTVAPPIIQSSFTGFQPNLAPPPSVVQPNSLPPAVQAPITVIKQPPSAVPRNPSIISRPRGSSGFPPTHTESASIFGIPSESYAQPMPPYAPPAPSYAPAVLSTVHLNAPTPMSGAPVEFGPNQASVHGGSRRGSGTKNGADGFYVPGAGVLMRTPDSWVTVPVPDNTGTGVKFRPRGYSMDTTSDGHAPWDTKDRYLMATRSGPGECPDHILAKHRDFKKGESGFASPYTVYYFDETAPNEILLDNDVRYKAPKKKPNTLIPPRRKPSLVEDSDGGSTRDSERTDAQVHAVVPQDTRLPETTKPPRRACCGAGRRRVSPDGASFYGDGSIHTVPQTQSSVVHKHDRSTNLAYTRHASGTRDSESSASSEFIIRKRDAHPNFNVSHSVPATYPPNNLRGVSTTSGSAAYTSEMTGPERKQRGCCGRPNERYTTQSATSSSGSSQTSSSTSEYTSSYSSSKSSVSTQEMPHTYTADTRSQMTASTAPDAKPTGCCGRPKARGQSAIPMRPQTHAGVSDGDLGRGAPQAMEMAHPQPRAMRAAPARMDGDPRLGGHTEESYGRTASGSYGPAPRAGRLGTNETDFSRMTGAHSGSYASRRRANSFDGRPYSDHWQEEGAGRVEVCKKKEKDRNYKYTHRKMFFDVEDLRVPENGTGLKMLPAYSTSYKNFPVICYDIVAPQAYNEFFRLRKTPGMYA